MHKHDDDGNEVHQCNGPIVQHESTIAKWPHTLLFNTGGGNQLKLSDLPDVFFYRDQQLCLRGAILYKQGHFATVIRCPSGWMFYDGMLSIPRFRFCPHDRTDDAMCGFDLANVAYEVMKQGELQFGMSYVDWSQEFYASGTYNQTSPVHSPLARGLKIEAPKETMADRLKGLSKEINEGAKKPASSPKKAAASPREGRIPAGFSLRATQPNRGKKARCAGCSVTIEYADACIRHRYRKRKSHKHDTIDHYHCSAKCITKMDKEHLSLFVKKVWVQSVVKDVVHELSQG